MFKYIIYFGHCAISNIILLGKAMLLLGNIIIGRPKWRLFPELIQQIYVIGVQSLAIIMVSGLFIGMVLALQGYQILIRFSAEHSLGPMVSLILLRELGPVVSALLLAGRAGSALTAEIGLMKATEQLSSMEIMAVDPLRRVIAPRFWAGVVSMPLLAFIFSIVGIYGSYLVGVEWLSVDSGSFWSTMQASVDFNKDIGNSVIKSVVFSVIIAWIALFNGYNAIPTAAGVSRATTRTVVTSSLVILGLDFLLTTLMFRG